MGHGKKVIGKWMKAEVKNCLVILLLICVGMMNFQNAQGEEEKQHELIRVGFFAMDGYHMIDANGNKSGYGYDFLRMMARYADVEYEYIGYDKSWGDMQKMLEDGEIDMVTSARKTPGREEKFDFSRPIGSSECMLAARSNNNSIVMQDYSTYDGMQVGLLSGNSRNEDFAEFAKKKGFTYTAVYFDLISEMEMALQSGMVDAIVSSSLRATENERVLETFAGEEIYAIVQKGNTKLLEQINYAIDQMNQSEGDWKTELYNRYFTSLEEKNLDFSDEEKEIIGRYRSSDQALRILCDPTRKPYSYVEDGQVKGILPDYFKKIAKYTGISYQFMICNSREEYLEELKNTDLYDIVIDLQMDEKTAEELHLGITVPYITIRPTEVVRRDFDGDIKTVATVDQAASREIEAMYAPDAKKLIYENRHDALQAVKDGKADAAFVQYYMAQEFVNNDTQGNLVYTMLVEPEFQYSMIITPEHSHALAGILTKAIYAMPDRTISDIASRYTSYKASDMNLKLFLQVHPFIALNIAVILMVLFIMLNVLFFMVHVKNKKLKSTLEEVQLNSEIISAIGKNYFSIYRINVERDYFEEISNDDETHRLTGNNGCASEKLYRICDTLVQPEYRPLVRPFLNISTLKERLKNEEYISTEYKMCDGDWHRIRFIVKKRDESGNVTHVLCVVRSISDSKRREENLYYEAEAAKREADMKTRFLATMSHDIRTPLNGIIGMINMAEQYADDKQMQQKIRAKSMESLKYLVSLVNDVLDMNKLQSGELQNQELSFDLVETLRELNTIYEKRAAEKQINYQVMWDRDQIQQPYLTGNPVYLGRILSNIADNAIKFSQPGSTISVWGKEESLDNDQVLLTLVCEDHGAGMSEELVKHAFDMFSQGNASSRSKYEGTGLGLAIVKQLVDRMGGSVELQSKVGSGTKAIVKLPFQVSTQEAVDNIVDRTENKGQLSVEGMRALVVEDNELNMEITQCMLEDNGLEVTCAVDGQEAVEIFEKSAAGHFDVIYMDIMMPRMNGLEAAKTIRAMKRKDAETVPIIATSANAFAEDVINSRLAGMNAHLSKPLDVNKMIQALKNCLAASESVKLRAEL